MTSSITPQQEFAIDVVRRLKDAGFQALWAGGCVRDLLMNRTPKDYDVATNAVPDEVRQLFGKRRTLAVGASFGVIIVRGPRHIDDVEVATFRTEGPYGDGRRPDHVAFSTPEEDAKRRDFTMNGMFFDPLEERVYDYVGGQTDLKAGVVRAIGNPHERMHEDKLRLMRAVRFAATMCFELEDQTAAAVKQMAEQIHVVSAERIQQELRRMLVDPHRKHALELMLDVGLLIQIFPELSDFMSLGDGTEPASKSDDINWQQLLDTLDHLDAPSFSLALAMLLHRVVRHKQAAEVCRRLKMSNEENDAVSWLVKHQNALNNAQQLPLCKLKPLLVHPLISELLAFRRAIESQFPGQHNDVAFCEEYLANTPADEINPQPLISGDDLIQLGYKPGKLFKQMLDAVRDAQLNNEISTYDEAVALIAQIASEE